MQRIGMAHGLVAPPPLAAAYGLAKMPFGIPIRTVRVRLMRGGQVQEQAVWWVSGRSGGDYVTCVTTDERCYGRYR